ncbi:MAG: hypothetical protein Q8L86_12530 [Vicinamibacterales bacterium]|nr:hypothetical protein [Vicinamibacterales bacterium]
MTGEEILSAADDIAEDDIPRAHGVVLLNSAKNLREDLRPWQFLKKLDSSKVASPGDTWQTSKALPADFRRGYKMFVGTNNEYFGLPFEQWIAFKNSARRYVIDLGNDVFYLTSSVGSQQTIYFFYIKTTTDFTVDTLDDDLLVWPDRFHPLLAFTVAAMFQGGTDYDDVSIRMSESNRAAAKVLDDSMVAWDNALKLEEMNHSFAGNGEADMNLGDM